MAIIGEHWRWINNIVVTLRLYRIKIFQNMHPVCKKANTKWILQTMWQSTKCYISGKSNTTHYWVPLSILAASCYGYACNCNAVICESGSKFREWKHLINKWNKHVTQTVHWHETGTETMTTGEGTKRSYKYRAVNQVGDGVQVSVIMRNYALRWWQVWAMTSRLVT